VLSKVTEIIKMNRKKGKFQRKFFQFSIAPVKIFPDFLQLDEAVSVKKSHHRRTQKNGEKLRSTKMVTKKYTKIKEIVAIFFPNCINIFTKHKKCKI
jgi:hypothetical protein